MLDQLGYDDADFFLNDDDNKQWVNKFTSR
jgi:hypothetical protein